MELGDIAGDAQSSSQSDKMVAISDCELIECLIVTLASTTPGGRRQFRVCRGYKYSMRPPRVTRSTYRFQVLVLAIGVEKISPRGVFES